MNKFLTGKELESAIYDIIWEAKNVLLIVSPYIKLDEYFKKLFKKQKDYSGLEMVLVFGKNEKKIKRSLRQEDFEFFKDFPNISIIYVPNLHAKYYGNEKKGIITSINLYDYSFKNNIEYGVYSEQNFLGSFRQSADNEAWNKSMEIADTHEVVFVRRPVYKKKKLMINIGKDYVRSETLFDSTQDFYTDQSGRRNHEKRISDFPIELDLEEINQIRPKRKTYSIKENKIQEYGFCIRTGKEIRFNPKSPMCKEAWKSWNQFKNGDYPEKYCHKTGKPSNGKTSMNHPILS